MERTNFVMDFTPIEFAPEDQLWARECMNRLESAFDLADRRAPAHGSRTSGSDALEPVEERELHASDAISLRWPEPQEPLAVILLADQFLQIPDLRARAASGHAAKHTLQQAVSRLGNWLLELVRSTAVTYDSETEHFVQRLAAEKSARLYVQTRGLGLAKCQGLLLQSMLGAKVPSAIRVGVDLLVEQPPTEWSEASQAIGALVQSHHWNIEDVYPRLLDATEPSVLSPALDLANHCVRKRGTQPHPAASRLESLLTLAGGVAQQLAALEEDPTKFSQSVPRVQRMLFDSVSLLVSLCDSFALIGDARAIPKLTQALDLRHRRIKAEAAFALAKLGEERAKELLLDMVQDDATRTRAIAYANELGLEDRIDPQWLTSLARARADLAIWLSQPEQFAIPPHAIELVEQRTLSWPGFDGPQECFLLRYEYRLGQDKIENIGFSGPFSAAVSFDLRSLSTDRCWEIFLANDVEDVSEQRYAWSQLASHERSWADPCVERLQEEGYESITPKGVFAFLGRRAVFCEALQNASHAVHVLSDGESVYATEPANASADFLYLQWKGQICMECIEGE